LKNKSIAWGTSNKAAHTIQLKFFSRHRLHLSAVPDIRFPPCLTVLICVSARTLAVYQGTSPYHQTKATAQRLAPPYFKTLITINTIKAGHSAFRCIAKQAADEVLTILSLSRIAYRGN
jgi:negative regulator of sigma E activity